MNVPEPLHRLGVMGGTFDPIHLGHLIAASEALSRLDLDRMLFVPTGRPWQKSRYSDAEDRFIMTSLAAASHPRFAVSRMELDRTGPTYSADTLEQLRLFHGPGTKLFFIIGADAALKLGTWHGLERLRGLTEVVAVARPGFDLEALKPEAHWPKVGVMQMPGIDISSSDIRARVSAGRPIDYLVPAEVMAYIRGHGLYVTDPSGELA
ncbi:MAG: nicotinate-nucleotide adenylyltransferase [Actinomycetota bacterium]|nr:nicotinate-nucleotide adenylyltransferase [Actinomycetota bacterium]